MHKRLGLTALAALALMAATAAQADTQPGFYAGAGIGSTKVGDDDLSGVDDSDTGFKIFGGYTFTENWGVEVSYFDFGEASVSAGNSSASVGITGLSASAVGRLPVNDMFAVYGKLGFASYDVDLDFNNVPGFGSGHLSDSDSDLIYGVGGALSFGGNFEARLEYEALNVDGDASMISVSGLFRF
ncbi:MAG TPA: outer membrane beta-barrel protein [Steroidobacteraceae bacterium]|jgi:OmpA-OmpF porin, OOP family|nr:outer membrane beta-barrel protein [Steroidobacteraceae bacterium]